MAEAVTIPSKRTLAAYLGEPMKDIEVKFYCSRDARIDWETWVVLVRGQAVGFTDGEVL